MKLRNGLRRFFRPINRPTSQINIRNNPNKYLPTKYGDYIAQFLTAVKSFNPQRLLTCTTRFIFPGCKTAGAWWWQPTSCSSGATTSIFERFGLLNIQFPLIAILDAASPILYFQFLHAISYIHLPICCLVSLVVVLTSVSTYILFLPFPLPAFVVSGQTS